MKVEGKKIYAIIILTVLLVRYIPALANAFNVNSIPLLGALNADRRESDTELKATKIGIGGGGALFEPAISPFNSNDMLVVPDMGGIYISHNKGDNWERANLHGTIMGATYDPNREGVIYAGGSGLWRSTDNGNTFKLIFPREDDITAKRLHNGNSLQYYFTKSGIYDTNRPIKNILIDPENSDHIFALAYSYKNGIVYESTDNGENFNRIFTYVKTTSPSIQFDFNELIYRRETKDLFAINNEFIMQYNLDTKEATKIYEPEKEIMDVSTVYENDKTYFVIIEKTTQREDSETIVYYTNDFENRVDFTDVIVATQPTYFDNNSYGHVTYKYDFDYVSATSLNNIYVTNCSYAKTSSIKNYPYTIDGIIHYKNGEASYLYGNPFHNHNYLSSRSWNDGCTYSLGIAASLHDEDEYIFTTLNGIYYAPDNEHIYPKHTTVTEGKYPNAKYVTNGIDEQRTYAVCEDPFQEGCMLLLNTDLGLIRSEDNGESWVLANKGIPSNWSNTIYDAEFDKRREGIVYSLWSGRHNAPYNAGNETDGRYGGFAISYDGGATWDSTYSSGLPTNTIPVKMSVIYQENSEEVTIYVATYNCGFYVSYNSGRTFTEMNNGIDKINYKDEEKYQYVFAQDIEVKDGHIYGLTTKTSYNSETQHGELFEYTDGTWVKIPLPKNVENPVDIYYNDEILYISSNVKSIWDRKNGADFNSYAGGIYTYKDGEFEQIFDESISITSVVFDSKDTMYVSDMEGNIYRKEKEGEYEKIYEDYHYRSESVQITEDDDRLYLSTHGGGMLKIENLNSLYKHEEMEYILGDVDGNGEVDVNDLAKLKLHLIEKEILISNNSLKAADIDEDGDITINDLARLKLMLIGLLTNDITVEDTSFNGYNFLQITPENKKVTYERIIMTDKVMEQYGSSGAGSQWPIALETSKDGELMLNGTDVAGINKSTDHGKTWVPSHSGFETRGVGMFAIDPYNNSHVLALGISRWKQNGGIYISYDTATTWEKGFQIACRGIRYLWDGLEFDPTTYDEESRYTMDVYFSTPYRRDAELRTSSKEEPEIFTTLTEAEVGLYKSTDGGKTFDIIINDKRLADGIVKITDNGQVYIGNQYGLFLINKETNTIERSYLENNPEIDYTKGVTGLDVVDNVIYAQTWDGIFIITEDGTLTKITTDETYTTTNWPQFLEVSESNPDHMVYMYRENVDNPYSIQVNITKDGGKTWNNSRFIINSSFYKLDGRNREKVFIIDPTDDNNIITFAGYNLERSSDGGSTFTQIAGISNTMQGGRFNFNYYNPDLMLFSAQDYTGAVTTDEGQYYTALKIQGKGNIYGGFAADEKTYFGFANETWWGGTLSVTHDAGKSWTDFGLEVSGVPGTPYYSCMQSYNNPDVLFASQYYSKDRGYTWQEMDGCVAVFTINYTGEHEIYGGDNDGNLVVSYDDGDTWTRLNSKAFYTANNIKDIDIINIAYDQVNNYAYVLINAEKDNSGNLQQVYKYDITNDIATQLSFPKDYYRGTMRIKTIAVDPNSVDVVYIGGSGDYYCSATGLIRSIDGGETWEVLTTAGDSHFEAQATNYGGYEVTNIRVNPIDGRLWISCGCYGYETIDPPYDSSLLNHKQNIEHTIKYVYNGKVVNEATIKNGKSHNYTYSVDGLEFIDWYTDEKFENNFSNGNNVYNSMVLYAKMKPSIKIELNVSDSIFKTIDLDKYDAGSIEFIPEREGYTFAGWFYDKELKQIANVKEITKNTTLYAGWYKVIEQIYNPESNDMAVYIAYSDHKIQSTKIVDNIDFVENRSICLDVDKNSTYLVTFKMDTRFRMGLAKNKFWSYNEVSEYYINENDNNGAVPLNEYVYRIVDTTSYSKMLIYYYTSTGSRDFMDIKSTVKVYKIVKRDVLF